MGGTTEEGVAVEEPTSQRLTNDDFRRLLMTPRASHAPAHPPPPPPPPPQTAAAAASASAGDVVSSGTPSGEDRGEARRKKKSYYAALKKQEDNKLAELAEKYRDRARERRDNANPDYNPDDPVAVANASNAYRAVAPDLKSGLDAKERRRQMIQESKFLGGDMEHTHLVKGLDYALLQKVRSEIRSRETEQEQRLERLADDAEAERIADRDAADDETDFETALGRDVYRTLAAFKSDRVERNEMFAPGRMAYVVDLEDADVGDTDIPTTLVRSRAELPSTASGQPTLTTNDIVINKLAQVLSYLRHGARHGKAKKSKEKAAARGSGSGSGSGSGAAEPRDDSIYGELGDYAPTRSEAGGDKKGDSYFDAPLEREKEEVVVSGAKVRAASLLSKLAAEPEGYAECYPGLREMDDAIEDSDDEADYTKMDVGNKKGPIGRWDFDTQEEYSAYMNQREALPKAAFQYGVKTMDGRKTRKTNKEKNDKAELDREWQQIQNIIQKRKGPKDKSGEEPDFKVPKY